MSSVTTTGGTTTGGTTTGGTATGGTADRSGARVDVLGIRHFGPGSARAVTTVLGRVRPDAILVEGPADADGIVHWAGSAAMVPPVALLGYEVATPNHAAFWPMAAFSPEWLAIRWGLEHRVPVRFADLPSSAVLAATDRDAGRRSVTNPLTRLAAAAGFDDADAWWDHVVESRAGAAGADLTAPFAALTEAMADLRALDARETGNQATPAGRFEAQREAYLRGVLRATLKSGAQRVVVVCGAWHAPALTAPLPPASHDAALLRGIPKVKTHLGWVPWSHARLAAASGYGAGVTSPGWYHHLFTTDAGVTESWLTQVARVLRARDLPVSSASVIEATRLANALADLRRRPAPGLDEVQQATLAVLCDGDELLARYVTTDLVVGHALGAVPEQAPAPPLDADLRATARRLRLRFEPTVRSLVLDLRAENDLARSRLLHRLRVLGVHWGTPEAVTGLGTFKEGWRLSWRPELSVDVVAAATWGSTVPEAASARAIEQARHAQELAEVTATLESVLVGDLADALDAVLAALADRAAAELDVVHLMAAFPALARAVRYGDVRGTDVGALRASAASLLVRILVGLPLALRGIDADAADELRHHLDVVHETTALVGDRARTEWLDRLTEVADTDATHPLLAGRALRILHGCGRVSSAEAAERMQRALSVGAAAPERAAWVEGFLAGEGLLLAHDDALLEVLDAWVLELAEDDFVGVLPLLRRTFGGFSAPERRAVGEQIRRLDRPNAGGPDDPADSAWFDPDLAAGPVATMALVLGLTRPSEEGQGGPRRAEEGRR